MRKPLVVVCAAASALVLAGGVAATAASAGETPDEPGWSFLVPEFPGFPAFGGPGMGDSGSAAGDDPAFSPGAAGDSDGAAGNDAGWLDDHGGDVADRPGTAGRPDAADRPAQQRPAQQRPSQQHPAQQRPGQQHPAQQRPGQQRPAQQRPAQLPGPFRPALPRPGLQRPDRQAQRPGGQRPGGQGDARPHAAAGAGLLAAAREGVTAGDVSSSPSAPVQQLVLALVNDNRKRHGCGELSVDRRLIEAANEHAADMARRRYFAHASPNGDGAGERVRDAGYRWKRYGENIARGADSPYEVVAGWMHSPSHRHNILDCGLHEMGIGLAIAGDRTPYWVQDFATPHS